MLLAGLRDRAGIARQTECAELLAAAGLTDAARLLYDVIFIQTGFSAADVHAQMQIALRTKLWGPVAWSGITGRPATQAATLAASQFEQLAAIMRAQTATGRRAITESGGATGPSGLAPAASAPDAAGLAGLCGQLCHVLRASPGPENDQELEGVMAGIDRLVLSRPVFTEHGQVGATLDALAAAFASNSLRAKLLPLADLAFGPFGSARLFHAAARLDGAGLGPYLGNAGTLWVETLCKDDAGLAALLKLAVPGQGRADDAGEPERRSFLLSIGLHGAALQDLIRALAAARMTGPIRVILARLRRLPEPGLDVDTLHRIRDAGLGGGDLATARDAQALVTHQQPGHTAEWIALGEIEAEAGNRAAAEAAFTAAIRTDYGNHRARDNLDALRSGRVGRFERMPDRLGTGGLPLAAVLRRSLLRLALAPSALDDQIDCADLAAMAGFPDVARVLYDVMFICGGFSAARIAHQAEIARSTGLWGPGWSAPAAPGGIGDNAAGVAIAQLSQIAASPEGRLPPPAAPGAAAKAGSAPGYAGPPASAFAALCRQVCDAFRQDKTEQSRAACDRSVRRLQREVLGRPFVDPSTFCEASTPVLAASIAFNILRDFLVSIRDLMEPPYGSVELFLATARLDDDGLGPYFSRADQFARTIRDVFGLIQLAVATDLDEEVDRDALERWSVLLSWRFGDGLMHDLVDALGDYGLMRALRAICERAAAQLASRTDPGLMWRIRDAGLDNEDFALAARAQELIATLRPDNAVEWVVLGEIEATRGNGPAAEAAFTEALTLDRHNRGAQERLEALQAGQFARFKVTSGFGTGEERKLVRRKRLLRERAIAAE